MSQRGSVPHLASLRSSRSPPGRDEASPRQHVSATGNNDGRPENSVGPSDGFGRPQQQSSKSLGVHNILNPFDSRHMPPEDAARSATESSGTSTLAGGRIYATSRTYYPAPTAASSHPGTPVGGMAPRGRPPSSERNSPVTGYPFPPLNDARTGTSPRLPRATSFSQAVPPREMESRRQSLLSSSSPAKRPYEVEPPEEQRQLPALPPSLGTTLPAGHSIATPPAAPGHPVSRPPDAMYMSQPPVLPRDAQGRPQSLPAHPQFQQSGVLSRPMSALAGPEQESWSDAMRRSGMGSNIAPAEGQQAFMTLPGSDTPIPVQVDYSQASKKADEKRQRNAKASTRHRRKKKTMQEENMRLLQDLKDERQQMAFEVDDLKRQRDFYREERNRLREIVARTAGIHQHAAGPPTPPMRSIESLADRSPGSRSHMPTPTPGYASDPSSAERPSQRRRTEDRPEYTTSAYGAPASGPHQAMGPGVGSSQAYGMPPRPLSASSSASGERLPPLRAMEGPAPVQGIGGRQPQEQDPRTGQWRPAQPRQYETGWATGARKTHEGHPAQGHPSHPSQWQ